MKKIIIFYTTAGGGHKATALALQAYLQNFGYHVVLLNPYTQLLKRFDLSIRLTGMTGEAFYNKYYLNNKYMHCLGGLLSVYIRLVFGLQKKSATHIVRSYLLEQQPACVLSVMPYVNQIIVHAIRSTGIHMPFYTLITDFTEDFKMMWLQSKEQKVICGTDIAQAYVAKKISSNNIYRISGMVVNQRFMHPLPSTDNAENKTILVFFGGTLPERAMRIIKAVDSLPSQFQLIVICGHNQQAYQQLQNLHAKHKLTVLGYCNKVHEIMCQADVLIGKPGPGVITEALCCQLPMIVEYNVFTMRQEKSNAKWLMQHGYGFRYRSVRHLLKQLVALLHDNRLAGVKARLSEYQNTALADMKKIIDESLC